MEVILKKKLKISQFVVGFSQFLPFFYSNLPFFDFLLPFFKKIALYPYNKSCKLQACDFEKSFQTATLKIAGAWVWFQLQI